MKPFTPEAKQTVTKKLDLIKRNLTMYSKYEAQLVSLPGVSETMKETAKKIPGLRADKAREVYTILHKYGWLTREDLDDDHYDILMEAISYGKYPVLVDILPYAKKAYMMGELPEEEYLRIIDYLNTCKTELENNPKTFN